jgi:phosphoribosylanthranilate isomerase
MTRPLSVKICGLRSEDALEAALAAGADFVGFVFFPASPRNVSLEEARKLGGRVRGRAGKVALSVDADDGALDAIVDALRPDALQLHGHEAPERVAAIQRRFGVPVIKAIAVSRPADLNGLAAYSAVADRLLFDARPPREATRPGGLGQPFDWRLLQSLETPVPFLLSGGLDSGNVGEALRITGAPGVDVSSGVERAPGEKDPEKIRAFIRAARQAAQALQMSASPA